MKPRRPTREEAIASAGVTLTKGILRTLSMDPHEAALGAYVHGGPSVEELESRIREMQARMKAAA